MTRKEFVTKATDSLAGQYSPGEAKAISVRILSHFLGLSEYEYSVEPGVIIPKPDLVRLQGALDELAADRPVQYVIGEESFAGHTFRVSESVLIPRPETEQLCRLVIDDWKRSGGHPEPRILDAGTGSGCIAWTLAAAFPKAEVFAFDIDRSALDTARSQQIFLDGACRQRVPDPPVFFQADILEGPPDAGDRRHDSMPNIEEVDILVSNPPYVCSSERDFMAPNVLNYEPETALFVPDNDPLRFYKALAGWAETLVRTGGKCWMEINEAYGGQVRDLFEGRGFSDVEILEDFRGKPRFVTFTKWF
ncbi:MAG TPA: peptide chain release factor N(5)-glutamine methyltransferase [Candidatus Coprenecus merdigallinarum]|nr:peptide chain release factor N(5)-glutamine methyltransferase [Candidatus Coprenecus merdigallinarum]